MVGFGSTQRQRQLTRVLTVTGPVSSNACIARVLVPADQHVYSFLL